MIISYVNIKTSLCQVLVEAVVLKKRKKKWKNTTEVFVSILFLFFHFFIFFLCQVPVATKTSSVSDAIVSYSIDVLYHNLVEEVVLKKRKKIFFLHMYSLYPIFQLSWSIHLMKVRHERSLGLSTVLITPSASTSLYLSIVLITPSASTETSSGSDFLRQPQIFVPATHTNICTGHTAKPAKERGRKKKPSTRHGAEHVQLRQSRCQKFWKVSHCQKFWKEILKSQSHCGKLWKAFSFAKVTVRNSEKSVP